MNQDTLNIFIILSIFVVTTCIAFVTYYFIRALKSMAQLTDDLDDITQNLKNKVQMKALAAIPALLVALAGKVIRRKRG